MNIVIESKIEKGVTVNREVSLENLTLHELDRMTADNYRRYLNNPDFKTKVNELETLRTQKLNQRMGVVSPLVPENPNNA